MAIEVLRIGQRVVRDDRVTTHVALVSRAFGAKKIFMDEVNPEIKDTLEKINHTWGGDFQIEIIDSWKPLLKQKQKTAKIVHLTMYGESVNIISNQIKSEENSINKFVAKIASDYNKPNGQKTINPEDVLDFLEKLDVRKFFGVGKVTAEKMYQNNWLQQVRENGVSEQLLGQVLERMKEDRMSPLTNQLSWLDMAGFVDITTWYKNYSFVVYSGSKKSIGARG